MTLRAALIVSAALMGATPCVWAQGAPAPAAQRLLPRQLALIVNDAEPNSVTIAEYYRKARAIPAANIIHVNIPGKPQRLDAARFRALKDSIDSQLPAGIEAVLMVWTAPYAVECNAITAAYTMGFDPGQCGNTCAASRPSAYFNATSVHPVADFRMRLSMLLPTESVAQAKAVIDRGVASGFRVPNATAYYLLTSQAARNSRAELFPRDAHLAAKKIRTKTLHADTLEGVKDIMIYQTGMAKVDKLDSLGFLPGALADHLTSFGGDLLGTSQMSSLRWLEAGATASYGSVSEPCNHWQKFPHPTVLLKHYLNGSSAIEAYWRSVAWPTQGLFIGEPLAAPYGR
ncbi:TIGR03790 family protein [Massilia antarctica]|uniref:TIGR03790 family protein n=1 Tax=Massilia antarctica TaxID=2765360 RepID=UPI0006BB7190|nr:TIGR03790 family protein [Massilia sp. H27-R4]MCY0914721.1 TIGR03790 family protein [Massilia sp. H27-R4]CUI08246.1 hypothetical protein BN2497_11269 [Janthinobacterium sp. CG23_2]CUU32032.1 hypothetical protein BN3177_11269 [Janthinobacterium sp. CG23_2]